jgi:glycosyltransferase involved in cell wall biosynthesis
MQPHAARFTPARQIYDLQRYNSKGEPFMKKIAVIIPSYNNRQWYERNLCSVLAQDYHHFRVIYVDDCSSDGTGDLVAKFIADHHSNHLIHLIRNPVRLGALHNLYNTIHTCTDYEIVVVLDGDDWLAHNRVLKKLNDVYSNPARWMTYGQYLSWPDNLVGCSREIPSDIINRNSFREYEWCTSHLRSFYAWLFKLIKVEDLKDSRGAFYQMVSDQAIMFPMLEMSGHRARFINEVLYIYNAENPINDHKVDRELQRNLETEIRALKPYARLDGPVASREPGVFPAP